MSIAMYSYDEQKNLVGRSNFFVDTSVTKDLKAGTSVHTNLYIYNTLDELTKSKPYWRFIATNSVATGSNKALIVDVKIYEDDDYLGMVSMEWKGRGVKLMVDNERITAKRERGRGYFTENPAKAALAIRKNFFKAAVNERIEKARGLAGGVIYEQVNQKKSIRSSSADAVFKDLRSFAESRLEDYLAFSGKHKEHEKYLADKAEHEVTVKIQKAFGALDKGDSILVVSDGTRYIVKDKEDVTILHDDDMPYDIRMKLGLLKLVQDKQMISDIGCRVNSNTFVLLREKEQQA